MEQTVWRGRRWSAANAYLRPAIARGNVAIVSGLAARVVITQGRATGVEIVRPSGRETIGASREVILSASSINTPKLLMLSGIGPAAHLAEHGIPVVADRPGVGANLQDHLELYIQMKSLKPVTLYSQYNYLGMARIGLQWLLAKGGLGTSNQFESRRLRPLRPRRRLPRHPVPFPAARRALRRPVGGQGPRLPGPRRPDALALARHDPAEVRRPDRPAGDPLQLHVDRAGLDRLPPLHPPDPRDLRPARLPPLRRRRDPARRRRADRRRARRLRPRARRERLPPLRHRPPRPPPTTRSPSSTPSAASSASRPCASPTARSSRAITNGNLNAPSIMVGEKAADHILGRRLPPSNLQPWINPRWRNSDR